MCVAPMSVYAQEAQTDVIEAVAEKKQDTESSSVPVLQKEGIEISEGTGYDLSKEPGAATVKALEQGLSLSPIKQPVKMRFNRY